MKIISSITEITAKEDNFPIFFWDKWKTVEEQLHHKQRLLCVDDEQNIVAFTVYQMKFFRKGDYLFVPLDKNGERLSIEKEKLFLDDFHLFLKYENLVDVMFPPSHVVLFNAIPRKCLFYKLGLMTVDVREEDAILSKMYKENKKQIRKAQEHCVEIYEGLDYLGDFYNSYVESATYKCFQALGYAYFAKLATVLKEHLYCCKIVCENNLESAYLCLEDKKNIYPLYSGTSFHPKYKGSQKYLLWNIYGYARNKGIEKYVSGGYRYNLSDGDPLHNVHTFKLGMGAEIEDGYHFIKVIHPFKYNLVTFALRVKSMLTGRDCSFVNLKGLDVKKSN